MDIVVYQNLTPPKVPSHLAQFCHKGHELTWKSASITQCGMCGQPKTGGSRYRCDTCNVPFCNRCVTPPVFGIECGLGHPMAIANVPYHLCDICGCTIAKVAFRCKICDFDVCESCRVERED